MCLFLLTEANHLDQSVHRCLTNVLGDDQKIISCSKKLSPRDSVRDTSALLINPSFLGISGIFREDQNHSQATVTIYIFGQWEQVSKTLAH